MSQEDGIESVWEYPRPPRLEPTKQRLKVVHGNVVIAESVRGLRVIETSHPPVYYIPPADVAMEYLSRAQRRQSFCEFKGFATYWNLDVSRREGLGGKAGFASEAAWSYPEPSPRYAALRDHLAFYASKVDECSVDGELVIAQTGDFYGGWITSRVKGPFKGAPGTLGW